MSKMLFSTKKVYMELLKSLNADQRTLEHYIQVKRFVKSDTMSEYLNEIQFGLKIFSIINEINLKYKQEDNKENV